jgi:hypothetical protein
MRQHHDPVVHAIHQMTERLDQRLEKIENLLHPPQSKGGHTNIHVTAVELKQEEPMPPTVDHMPPLQLPASTLRAKLSVVDPRNAGGTRLTSVTWSSSDEAQVSIEAIPDDTVKDENGAEVLDPVDNLPLAVFSTYGNTPLDAGEATITVKAAGMADCDIVVKYSDPPVGHFAIVGVQAPEA